jgi:hypothetical protein
MKKSTSTKKFGKKGAAVTGVAAIAVLAALFGTGKLGFGTGVGLGEPAVATGKEEASIVETAADTRENPDTTAEAADTQAAAAEIRIQGREYNYQNVTYGNSDHPLEELLEALKEFPSDARIDLIVEDNATKNAVDDLENALAEAGFQNVHK